MKHLLLLAMGLFFEGQTARADAPDVPDASVGTGGAEHSSEENDGTNQVCLDSSQCDMRTSCVKGRCVPTATRTASGCGGGGTAALLFAGAVVAATRRRSEPNSVKDDANL